MIAVILGILRSQKNPALTERMKLLGSELSQVAIWLCICGILVVSAHTFSNQTIRSLFQRDCDVHQLSFTETKTKAETEIDEVLIRISCQLNLLICPIKILRQRADYRKSLHLAPKTTGNINQVASCNSASRVVPENARVSLQARVTAHGPFRDTKSNARDFFHKNDYADSGNDADSEALTSKTPSFCVQSFCDTKPHGVSPACRSVASSVEHHLPILALVGIFMFVGCLSIKLLANQIALTTFHISKHINGFSCMRSPFSKFAEVLLPALFVMTFPVIKANTCDHMTLKLARTQLAATSLPSGLVFFAGGEIPGTVFGTVNYFLRFVTLWLYGTVVLCRCFFCWL
jgi:hypothetical protein